MIDLRQEAFNNISRVLAITRYDIEQRQLANEYGLNIHGENFFRDVFNFVYNDKFCLENDNFNSRNSACIDLIDKKKRIAYQITTTRTKEKIVNTLQALKQEKYKGYTIKIFFLLEKANPNKNTIAEIKKIFGLELNECLLDYTDLIRDIENLKTNKLIKLNKEYFANKTEKYTDEIVLNLVFKHLITNYSDINPNYDDNFGTVDTNDKLEINNINGRIASEINKGLDYIGLVNEADSESDLMTDLRKLVVDDLYKKIVMKYLLSKASRTELESKPIEELHNLCKLHKLDFNKIIFDLHKELENKIEIKDYNSMQISWIVIAFFFEICDIGIKE
jgi:hypothetical protein